MRLNILRRVFTVKRENQEKAMNELMLRIALGKPGAIILVSPEEQELLEQREKLERCFWCRRRNESC